MTMEIPCYSAWTANQHVQAAEIGLAAAARMAAAAVTETAEMAGDPEDLALLALRQGGVQVYLMEANTHATLAVAKLLEGQNR